MDKQRIEGGLKKATGTIKEKVGQITGDRETEAEGKAELVNGELVLMGGTGDLPGYAALEIVISLRE